MPDVVLGIDTSNYTTSMALCDVEGRVLHNGKKLLPVKEGECGLRQSDAFFQHIKNPTYILLPSLTSFLP
jgi:N6-L-threonylcarbamoyladenine synthase